ncbi:hypothetical protein AbraCBS73388_004725 [Aspergillus brasiliensis]|uniref:non-specific serine/threonine protein kinase n=1 Tax=Aspergillus brasiliensis TaxID=319629 RepID=A0A9W5YKN2_9EURO|nr:hypothetical protein AbraCBS73388_004725 [Aspergillus brasiliensis]
MKLFRHHLNKPIRSLHCKPTKPLSSKTISPNWPIEEERSPQYNPRKYYPARIGETIGRYRIISKLGWGANSTAWLAKDASRWPWQSTRYVTLKITNSGDGEKKAAEDELKISQHISSLQSNHEGRAYVRLVQDSFQIQGIHGDSHICLVFEPLREPLWLLGRHLGSNGVPLQVLRAFLRVILCGLDFLHSECHIIHTDLKADNFLVGFEDPTVLKDYARQQEVHPAPADIWNLGTVLWELLADEALFNGLCDHQEEYSREVHIAQMIRLLGPPPSQFLDRCDPCIRDELFSPQGSFRFPELIPSGEFNFSNMTPFLHGEDQRLFIEFVRRMLRWEPERRSSAKELYNDPWLSYKS